MLELELEMELEERKLNNSPRLRNRLLFKNNWNRFHV